MLGFGLEALTVAAAWLAGGVGLAAQTAVARPGENLALGKPYTLNPAPDYAHCTDPGDATQLTDGQYTSGYFWTQKGTVGWNNANPAIITIDLGKAEPIRGVSFNMAAGVAGVDWPQAIYVLVSDDGSAFRQAGELVSLSAKREALPKAGYAVHRFGTDALQTHGRYVGFVLAAAGYGFVDEIEVYRGEQNWMGLPLAGEPISDLRRYFGDQAVARGVMRRLGAEIAAVRELAKGLQSSAASQEAEAELQAVTQELPGLAAGKWPADFRAVLPMNDLHRRVFRAQARLWRAAGVSSMLAWQTPLWDALAPVGLPQRQGPPEVTVQLMAGEYRAGAFNLSNPTEQDATPALRILDLPEGPNPAWITVHEVQWTDTRSGQAVAAALPPAQREGDHFEIHVPAGLTRQVWFTVHPAEIPAGRYRGRAHRGAVHRSSLSLAVPAATHAASGRLGLHGCRAELRDHSRQSGGGACPFAGALCGFALGLGRCFAAREARRGWPHDGAAVHRTV